jgi:hypothetical protein
MNVPYRFLFRFETEAKGKMREHSEAYQDLFSAFGRRCFELFVVFAAVLLQS